MKVGGRRVARPPSIQNSKFPIQNSHLKHPILSLVAFAFYATHAAYHLLHGHPEDLLWACHLGSVLVGVGFAFALPLAIGIAFLWLIMGNVLWGLDLSGGSPFLPTSLLTHVGGLVLAVVGLREYGMPRNSWWKAVLGLLVLQLVCRWATPAAANVNLSFSVWKGWENLFPSYGWYMAILTAAALALFWVIERLSLRAFGVSGSSPAAS